jgi:hypothetical protein
MTDRAEPRRPELTRELLRRIGEGLHEGVISNVVLEELERAPVEICKMVLEIVSPEEV